MRGMDRAVVLKLALFLVFLALQNPGTNSQWAPRHVAPRPLCVSQFALATHACAFLPFYPGSPPSPPPPPDSPDENHPSLESPDELDAGRDERGNHGNDRGHGHGHGDDHGHRNGHGHRHRRQRHRHGPSPLEEDCCRWLGAIDSECVCDLLVYLPPFLSRPVHMYTVGVQDSCNVTFQCGSRLRP